MSFARSAALQEAVFSALTGSAALAALVGDAIHDAPRHADAPEGATGPHVTLGEERVEPWTAQGLDGAVHDLEIGVHVPEGGYAAAKRIGAAVTSALLEGLPALSEGRVVTSGFLGARTRREKEGRRRLDLRFRFRIEA